MQQRLLKVLLLSNWKNFKEEFLITLFFMFLFLFYFFNLMFCKFCSYIEDTLQRKILVCLWKGTI